MHRFSMNKSIAPPLHPKMMSKYLTQHLMFWIILYQLGVTLQDIWKSRNSGLLYVPIFSQTIFHSYATHFHVTYPNFHLLPQLFICLKFYSRLGSAFSVSQNQNDASWLDGDLLLNYEKSSPKLCSPLTASYGNESSCLVTLGNPVAQLVNMVLWPGGHPVTWLPPFSEPSRGHPAWGTPPVPEGWVLQQVVCTVHWHQFAQIAQ